MAKLMKFGGVLKEGEFLNKWFYNRTIENNKNVILAFTGATGSGKTYDALSAGESWYQMRFKQEFPMDHVCFSLGKLMKKIVSLHKEGKIRKGEYFILEEAGANFGNLDFQNKIAKMFSYVLQSFRSMNLILVLTVPVLNMINKSARLLIHGHFITSGIDYKTEIGKVRPFFHQLAQKSGKSYWKYPRLRFNGKIRKIQRLTFHKPSKRLILEYEAEKQRFVIGLGEDFIAEYNKMERDEVMKDARKDLTPIEAQVLELFNKGVSQLEIARIRDVTQPSVAQAVQRIKKKGYRMENLLGNRGKEGYNLTKVPV